MIALLAVDVMDLPVHLLRRAILDWSHRSKFMPKASELIELCRSYVNLPKTALVQQLQDHVDKLNKYEWVIASGCPYFVNKRAKKSDGTDEHFVDRYI